MKKEQVKGKMKEGLGVAQQHLGRVTGNREQEARGHAREQQGKVEKKIGDAKDAVDKMTRKP